MSIHAWLARHVTYPAHEWWRGRATLRELATLQHQATLPAEAVQRIARDRLRGLLSFASEELPYYRELFARCGVDPHGESPQSALWRLPVLNKAVIRANADGMRWRDRAGEAIAHSSGGTTGDTLHFCIDRIRQAQTHAARLFMQRLFGVRPGERRVHLWGSPIENRGTALKRWRDRLINEHVLNAFEMSPRQMDGHLDRLERLRPRLLYGYPSAVALLVRHADQRNRRAGFRGLRLVVLTGEEVTPAQKSLVSEMAGCAVAAEYGSRETGLIAHDCPSGRMHVVSPHVHVEIAREGRVAARGACGDILCTTLNTRAQPFIHYRIGDVGVLGSAGCDCGLPFPLLRIEGGKVTGFIALADGRICHGAVTSHLLRDEPGIIEFKTHQRAVDLFDIELVVDDSFEADAIGRVRRRYRELFGPRVEARCRVVDRIEPDPSGKRRYVVSDVVTDLGEREIVDASR